jgi:hypothetical protein
MALFVHLHQISCLAVSGIQLPNEGVAFPGLFDLQRMFLDAIAVGRGRFIRKIIVRGYSLASI